jgi:dinuclear metal center YbgI/SA1388 family protein
MNKQTKNQVSRQALDAYLQELLQVARFADYCPNGLQVEGRGHICRIVSGVTASLALIEAAIDSGADALLVHHGYFWRGEDARVIGQKQRRLKALLAADISLFAYHLPLDAHPELGNNAQLALRLGLAADIQVGEKGLVSVGRAVNAGVATVGQLAAVAYSALNRAPLVVGDAAAPLKRIAWCTGGAQGYIEDAYNAGATAYISGEISEPTAHFAREMGIAYLACGHHATERYGVQALGAHVAQHFGIQHVFIDVDNPA